MGDQENVSLIGLDDGTFIALLEWEANDARGPEDVGEREGLYKRRFSNFGIPLSWYFIGSPSPAPINSAPVVAITGGNRTVADTNGTAGESVALTATVTDSDGTIAIAQWLVSGQVVATGTSATLSLPDGATTVTFRATDNSGATTSTSAVITIGGAQAQRTEYLGTYNGIALDPRYNLEVNRVGLIIIDRSRLHSCVRIFEGSKPAQVAGMNEIDVTFNILSLESGAIQIFATRPFTDQSATDKQPANCSGRFDAITGIYRDYINLGAQLFDAEFKLINGDTLEFMLLGAREISMSR